MNQPDRIKQFPIVLCIDFDAVIHKYSKGWHDGSIYDPPMEGAKEALDYFRKLGIQIIIHTTRACDRIVMDQLEPNQLNDLKRWLALHEIPYDSIWTEKGKPLCHLYLDDRGYRFEGDWKQSTREVISILCRIMPSTMNNLPLVEKAVPKFRNQISTSMVSDSELFQAMKTTQSTRMEPKSGVKDE